MVKNKTKNDSSVGQQKIGKIIKNERERQGLTQTEFAQKLGTSQSAVARIEKGEQNLTLKEINKIANVLESKLATLSPGGEDLEIVGGKKLNGEVATNTSKNGALALMGAAVLNRGTTILRDIPRNEEVFRFIEVFESLGIQVSWVTDRDLKIVRPKKLDLKNLNQEVFARIRVGLYLIPSLLQDYEEFKIPNPGGCKMGERTISAHKYALENFGVKIVSEEKNYHITHKPVKKVEEVVMFESSDTGCINALLMAARHDGETVISLAPPNYQVQDVCLFLQSLGVKVEGVGTTTLKVTGLKQIDVDVTVYNSPDPIESMFFISVAAVTKSEITVKNCPIDFLKLELLKLKKMGFRYTSSAPYLAKNKYTKLVDIKTLPSEFTALPDKIHPQPYPGINVDNLPFFVPIAALATGTTLVHDWMWENRAIYFTELNRLGAKVKLADPHRVFVEGVKKFSSAQIVCPPALRPATIILVAMLAAEGKSILRNIYSIKRGYEDLVPRLNQLGADVKILNEI